LTLVTEIGMNGLNYCIIKISSDPKFKGPLTTRMFLGVNSF